MNDAIEQSNLQEGYEEVKFGPKTLAVPNDWTTERFGDVFQRRRESVDEIENEAVKYVGLKHLDSGQLDINGYDENGRERSSSRVFRKGDVLFGKLRPNLNKAAIAPFSGVCSSDIIPIYAEKAARQQYLPYLMHSKLVRDRVVSTMEGTNLPRTSWGDLEKTLIPLPPLPEQRRIADILSTVDEHIQLIDEVIGKAAELKKGLMQDLLTHGIYREDKKETGSRYGKIPNSWTLRKLKEIGEVVGRTAPEKDQTECWGGDIPWATPSEITSLEGPTIEDTEEHLTQLALQKVSSNLLPPGSILMTTRATIGECAVNNVEMTTNQGFKNLIPGDDIDMWYAYYRLNNERKYLKTLAKGSTFPEVGKDIVENFLIPVPHLDEQKQIGKYLKIVDELILSNKSSKEEYQTLKRGLMQDLLTGKVRVDPE